MSTITNFIYHLRILIKYYQSMDNRLHKKKKKNRIPQLRLVRFATPCQTPRKKKYPALVVVLKLVTQLV